MSQGHARGLLMPLAGLGYFLVSAMLISVARDTGDRASLLTESLLVRLGDTVLLGMALVLPLATLPFRRRRREIGKATSRSVILASCLSHGIVLLGSASGLAVLGLALLTLRSGFPDGPQSRMMLREPLGEFPSEGLRLRAGPQEWAIPIGADPLPVPLKLELRGKVGLPDDAAVRGALSCKGVLRVRSDPSSLLEEIPFELTRGRPVVIEIGERRTRVSDRTEGVQSLSVACLDEGKEIILSKGSLTLLLGPRPLLPSFLRSFYLASLKALMVAVLVHFLLTWVRYPLALVASSVAILVGSLTPLAAFWQPSGAASLLLGQSVEWPHLARPLLLVAALLFLAWAMGGYAIRVAELDR